MKPFLLLLAGLSVSSTVRAAPSAKRAPGVAALSRQVAVLLKRNDTRALSRLVDARRGLQFSPDVQALKSDVRLSRAQVARLRTDPKVRNWGNYYGEDGPIRLNWAAYRKQIMCPRDFTSGAQLSINQQSKSTSLSRNNYREFYPGATWVELYLPPTTPGGMDWANLWMVWRKGAGTWRLIGIANEQWTP